MPRNHASLATRVSPSQKRSRTSEKRIHLPPRSTTTNEMFPCVIEFQASGLYFSSSGRPTQDQIMLRRVRQLCGRHDSTVLTE